MRYDCKLMLMMKFFTSTNADDVMWVSTLWLITAVWMNDVTEAPLHRMG